MTQLLYHYGTAAQGVSDHDQNWIHQGEGVGCVTDDRQTHGATQMCITNTPRDAEPTLDFEVILQFRSGLISLFL